MLNSGWTPVLVLQGVDDLEPANLSACDGGEAGPVSSSVA